MFLCTAAPGRKLCGRLGGASSSTSSSPPQPQHLAAVGAAVLEGGDGLALKTAVGGDERAEVARRAADAEVVRLRRYERLRMWRPQLLGDLLPEGV